jgi:hypothetical protein
LPVSFSTIDASVNASILEFTGQFHLRADQSASICLSIASVIRFSTAARVSPLCQS